MHTTRLIVIVINSSENYGRNYRHCNLNISYLLVTVHGYEDEQERFLGYIDVGSDRSARYLLIRTRISLFNIYTNINVKIKKTRYKDELKLYRPFVLISE